jgi:hypothetical protein
MHPCCHPAIQILHCVSPSVLSYTVSMHPGCHPAAQTTPLCVHSCLVIHSEHAQVVILPYRQLHCVSSSVLSYTVSIHPGRHPDVFVIQISGCRPNDTTAHVLAIVQVSRRPLHNYFELSSVVCSVCTPVQQLHMLLCMQRRQGTCRSVDCCMQCLKYK